MGAALSKQEGSLLCLALDWSKAFDTVCPGSLLEALRRFGIPESFIKTVAAIYKNRSFQVKDCKTESTWRHQAFGICRVPAFPFPFFDCDDNAGRGCSGFGATTVRKSLRPVDCYADDTLILETKPETAQYFMDVIADKGREYALSLNWDKVRLLRMNSDANITTPHGTPVEAKLCLKYLGEMIYDDGSDSNEISRRIGLAKQDLQTLRKFGNTRALAKPRRCKC
jgi:hypothetical protein